MYGTYIGNNKMLIRTIYGGTLIVPASDLSITPNLILDGGMEIPLTNYFLQNIKPGNIIVDIGANVGYFTVLLGLLTGPSGKTYAFEPNPYLYPYLFDNLSLNYLHDRVVVKPMAVYSTKTTLAFHVSKRYMGNSSIQEHDQTYTANYKDDFEKIQIEAIPLEEEFPDFREKENSEELTTIDFLKIDIEGGEFHAFKGFHELIIRNNIKTIIFELNKPMLQNDWPLFVKLLQTYKEEYNKKFFILSENGIELAIDLNDLIKLGGYPYAVMK